MCGLFGVMSDRVSHGELDRLQVLGILSQIRGLDSTGIACISKPSFTSGKINVDMHKNTLDATGFFLSEGGQKILKKPTIPLAYIGHCRAATAGHVTVANAHPFIIDNKIVGTHNGTINELRPKHHEQDRRTDSLELYERISKKGLTEALADAGLGAAFALVWYNTTARHICMIRNKDRPLFLMRMTGSKTIYYASEKRMLEFIANGDPHEITHLETDILYSFDVEDPTKFSKVPIDYRKTISDRWQNSGSGARKSGRTFPTETYPGYTGFIRDTEHSDSPFLSGNGHGIPQIEGPKQEGSTTQKAEGQEEQSAKIVEGKIYVEPRPTEDEKKLLPSFLHRPTKLTRNATVTDAEEITEIVPQVPPGRFRIINKKRSDGSYSYKRIDKLPTIEDPLQGLPTALPATALYTADDVRFSSVDNGIVADFIYSKGSTKKRQYYPRFIKNSAGDVKMLFYRGPHGLFVPIDNQELRDIFNKGCAYSSVIPPMQDKVRWINGTQDYILDEYINMPYLKEYYNFVDEADVTAMSTRSNLIYFSLKRAAENNKRRSMELLV